MPSDHFSTQSAEYARFRPTYPEALFDWLAAQTEMHDLAWDCACGNGQATRPLAERFKRVVGTDHSPQQIDHAPRIDNVTWKVATAESSGLESSSVDLITVAQAVHWFDLPRFWDEVKRVLKPGGVVAVWCYGVFQIPEPPIQAICDHFYESVLDAYWPPERRLVEAGYAGLSFPFDAIAAPAFEIARDWELDALLGYLSSWSATVRCAQATGQDPIPALREALTPAWMETAYPVRWPISILAGRQREN